MRLPVFAITAFCFSTVAAQATPLSVTESGKFSSSTPTSSISAPNGTFALSFNVDSSPTVVSSSANQFAVVYSNFSFLLNGIADTAKVGSISFFDSADSGLFSICFSTPCPADAQSTNSLVFLGPQVFKGLSSNPQIAVSTLLPARRMQTFPLRQRLSRPALPC